MKLWEQLKDWYITKKTGKNKAQREWEEWYYANVNYRASTIGDMFKNFKHVIEVDFNKFVTDGGMTWVPVEDARQYFWPQCELGKNAVWRIEGVSRGQWGNEWCIDHCWGEDRVFVATNSDQDATMISLMYS